jgi:ABC-2 type transport system ATP-binding protein
MPPAIEISHLTKDFPLQLGNVKLRAVDDLSLEIEPGCIYGLLGPNGSGKSTTIKILLGLLEPTLGECHVFGVPCQRVEARLDVGYLPEAPYFYRFLTGYELVEFYAKVCGVARSELKARVAEVIAWVGLTEAAHRRVGTYSKGMLQRIGLAQALVHDPKLIILDEPTAGVDPVGSAEISRLILGLKERGKTVLLCSHLLGQVEDVCDRIAILNRGRLIVEGPVNDLIGRRDLLSLVIERVPDATVEEFRAWLAARGGKLVGVEQPRSRLDQLFLERVAEANRR